MFTHSNENHHPFNISFKLPDSLAQPAQTRDKTPDLPDYFDCPDAYA
jgi:hypothetical protein